MDQICEAKIVTDEPPKRDRFKALSKMAGPPRKNETFEPFVIPGRRNRSMQKLKDNKLQDDGKSSESSDLIEAIGPKGL